VAQELAGDDATSHYVAAATWFVSHTWSNPFAHTMEAIIDFFEGPAGAAAAFLWFDVFVDSQHEAAGAAVGKSPEWYMTTFKSSIARIGNLVLVVDAWGNPTALQRAWSVAAAACKPSFAVCECHKISLIVQVCSRAARHREQERRRKGWQVCRCDDQARADEIFARSHQCPKRPEILPHAGCAPVVASAASLLPHAFKHTFQTPLLKTLRQPPPSIPVQPQRVTPAFCRHGEPPKQQLLPHVRPRQHPLEHLRFRRIRQADAHGVCNPKPLTLQP